MSAFNNAARRGAKPARWPWAVAAAVLVFGVMLSLYAWRALRRIERRAMEDDFRAQAAALAQRVAREVKMIEDVLVSISHLHTISERISSEDFAEFVEKGMHFHREVLGAFGFVQQIDEETRVLLETSETNALRILRRDPEHSGRFVGAPMVGIYYPLTYQYPKNGLGLPLGFDFGSDPVYAQSLSKMIEGRAPVVGGPAPGDGVGERLFLFAPIVYMVLSEPNRQPVGHSVVGFTVGLFDPLALVTRALGGAPVFLERAGWSVEWGMRVESRLSESKLQEAERIVYDVVIPVADMPWEVRFSAKRSAFLPVGRQPSTTALIIGLVATFGISAELLMLAGRGRRIEKLVESRTAALREAKEQLEKEMHRRRELEEELLNISLREKVRVGQDLHDSLGQKLTGAVLLSGVLARSVPENAREEAKSLHDLLKHSVAQVRRMARGLAPVELGERGLVGALEQLAEETREAGGEMECELRCDDDVPPITGKQAEHLYHIAQEAVTNALRHSGASEISILLKVNRDQGELIVCDNGRGFNTWNTNREGLGLEIMRHRAELIGAELLVESAEKRGTKIVCRFPLRGEVNRN